MNDRNDADTIRNRLIIGYAIAEIDGSRALREIRARRMDRERNQAPTREHFPPVRNP